MIPEVFATKEIFNILGQAGVPKIDFPFWAGARGLNFTVSQSLLQYLKTATVEEIKKLNSLLKEKIEILKSFDQDAWRALVAREKGEILQ